MGTLERYLIIALGSAIGGCARFAVGAAFDERLGPGFPWGTLFINVGGSFAIGAFLSRAPVDPRWRMLVAVGLCGGYTTFSTFAWETSRLVEAGRGGVAFGYVAASVLAGLGAVYAGAAVGRWIG